MKKPLLIFALVFQIVILSSFWTNLYAITWMGNTGSYATGEVTIGTGGAVKFFFPPNTEENFMVMSLCIDGFPDDYLYVEYHTNRLGKNIVDFASCI